ncbi:MAG: hypothetical protein IPL58_01220 [Betaproteobacteria bacterium]|uniref:Uncharacterized protein n=1 Tax=Candidatus Proximibacter danicus TaxID=2954365 RepID=A0A9D7K170_9PROT|nr:hypothetical protein [Candidatus Proximibacter danicus]
MATSTSAPTASTPPEGFVQILSHELGHQVVENPSAVIANARKMPGQWVMLLPSEASCHMTEGARLATAKVIDEITAGPLDGVTRARLTGAEEYKQYKVLLPAAAETSWTAAEMDSAPAHALGDSNKGKTTSNTGTTYLQYCKVEADGVAQNGLPRRTTRLPGNRPLRRRSRQRHPGCRIRQAASQQAMNSKGRKRRYLA